VLRECLALWRALPKPLQGRIHLVCVPMNDADEAATVVNALQRHATVVVQKSFAEGFGLTVVEAMWKSRAVVGTAVGGIVDQIVSGDSGVLLDDPRDLEECGKSVTALLGDAETRNRIGASARRRATEHFLGDRHLAQWAELFDGLDGRA
jgi:trehalose synthase